MNLAVNDNVGYPPSNGATKEIECDEPFPSKVSSLVPPTGISKSPKVYVPDDNIINT